MTLDEAIEFEKTEVLYYESIAEDKELDNWRLSDDALSITEQCRLGADIHRQYVEWLTELKTYRERSKEWE